MVFGDVDTLGFVTLYVRMNAAPPSPGSSAGRLKACSNDGGCELFENLLWHVVVDAEFYKRPFDAAQG